MPWPRWPVVAAAAVVLGVAELIGAFLTARATPL